MSTARREGRCFMQSAGEEWRVESIDDWGHLSDSVQLETADEPMGTKEKFWVRSPDDQRLLFKYARFRHGRTMGEDWVEWAVYKLASMLSVPAATAIPATYQGKRGVLSVSVLSSDERLIHGNELLARSDPKYDLETSRQNPRYTVEAVHEALAEISAPRECAPPIRTAFDAWAGYVMLDAWVAGRDRHHENWAAIEHGGHVRLAPTFDHGNALGFQEPEPKIEALAQDAERVVRWAKRGSSHHFSGKPDLVQLAMAALDLTSHEVGAYWLMKLAEVADHEIESVFESVPTEYLSEAGRTFRTQLLLVNRERILHAR